MKQSAPALLAKYFGEQGKNVKRDLQSNLEHNRLGATFRIRTRLPALSPIPDGGLASAMRRRDYLHVVATEQDAPNWDAFAERLDLQPREYHKTSIRPPRANSFAALLDEEIDPADQPDLLSEIRAQTIQNVLSAFAFLDDGASWSRRDLIQVLLKWTLDDLLLPGDASEVVFRERLHPFIEQFLDSKGVHEAYYAALPEADPGASPPGPASQRAAADLRGTAQRTCAALASLAGDQAVDLAAGPRRLVVERDTAYGRAPVRLSLLYQDNGSLMVLGNHIIDPDDQAIDGEETMLFVETLSIEEQIALLTVAEQCPKVPVTRFEVLEHLWPADFDPAAAAGAPCTRCSSPLAPHGTCTDQTCPFSDHSQSCEAGWSGHESRAGLSTLRCSCSFGEGDDPEATIFDDRCSDCGYVRCRCIPNVTEPQPVIASYVDSGDHTAADYDPEAPNPPPLGHDPIGDLRTDSREALIQQARGRFAERLVDLYLATPDGGIQKILWLAHPVSPDKQERLANRYHTCTCDHRECQQVWSGTRVIDVDFEHADLQAPDGRTIWYEQPCRRCGGKILHGASFTDYRVTGNQLLAHAKLGTRRILSNSTRQPDAPTDLDIEEHKHRMHEQIDRIWARYQKRR